MSAFLTLSYLSEILYWLNLIGSQRTRQPAEISSIGILSRKSRMVSESKRTKDIYHSSSFCFSAYTVVFDLSDRYIANTGDT